MNRGTCLALPARTIKSSKCLNTLHVIGTNGGRVSCGAVVDMFGNKRVHLCDECEAKNKGGAK